jgi:hypothetical protein
MQLHVEDPLQEEGLNLPDESKVCQIRRAAISAMQVSFLF